MSILLNGDCLEEMKGLDDNSVDFIFCDLPYGQTSCKWDCCIDLEQFWKEIMRIKKLHTPIFMTTTTKFGVSLINSAPKKCPFRYDLVWVKSASTSFLLSQKMPMRKHEMVYAFYEKLPFYDLSSHKHKFIKHKENTAEDSNTDTYGKVKRCPNGQQGKYNPPLPTSIVKEDVYGNPNRDIEDYKKCGKKGKNQVLYDPPLLTTMLEIKSTRGKHSTEKPVALMEWLLKYYTKEGDVVLDPTMGSGSTGVACKNLSRNFIGIEKDEKIFEVACERIYA